MKSRLSKHLPLLGLVCIIAGFAGFLASREPLFLTGETLAQMFKYYSPLAMLALGMTFIILTGGIDLSVGFVMMMFMFIIASRVKSTPPLSTTMALAYGAGAAAIVGSLMGGAVAYGRIPAFIVSLALMVASYGVTLILSNNQSINDLPADLLWLGGAEFKLFGTAYPVMMLVVVGAYLLASLLLNRCQFGRHIYAIGSNREAARLSGIRVPRTEMMVYVLSALCGLVAAVMQIGVNRTADPKVALSDNLELYAISMVVIGGTSLTGGRGTVLGTFLGWLLLSLILYGLPLIGINDPAYKKIIQGSIILLGAILDVVQRRVSKSRA